MNCPICNIALQMSERQGVEIDYCPKCRGVWLDRGELDKIIERSNAQSSTSIPLTGPTSQHEPLAHKSGSDNHDEHEHNYKGHYKRKSWLGELFD